MALGTLLGCAAVLLVLAGASPLLGLAALVGEVSAHSCLFLLCWIAVLLLAWQQNYRMKSCQPYTRQNEQGDLLLLAFVGLQQVGGAVPTAEQGAPRPVYAPKISWRMKHGCSLRAEGPGHGMNALPEEKPERAAQTVPRFGWLATCFRCYSKQQQHRTSARLLALRMS